MNSQKCKYSSEMLRSITKIPSTTSHGAQVVDSCTKHRIQTACSHRLSSIFILL